MQIAECALLLFQISNVRDPSLRVCNHLNEEVCKRGPAELGILAPVQVSVVYALLVRRVPQAGALVWCAAHRCASCLCYWLVVVRLQLDVGLLLGSCNGYALRCTCWGRSLGVASVAVGVYWSDAGHLEARHRGCRLAERDVGPKGACGWG
jgi:hypothetical protein